MDQEHDKGFRDLLSNASVFVSLLRTFVKASWTAQVKPEQLELVRTSFIISAKTGSLTVDTYFYCLLELQSSVDFSMPVMDWFTEKRKEIISRKNWWKWSNKDWKKMLEEKK